MGENRKRREFANKAAAGLEPQENVGHGLTRTADHDVTQTINDESVWTTRKYVAFPNRNRELYDEVVGEEINPLGYKCEKGWEKKYRVHEQSIKRKYGRCGRI